MTLAWLTEAGDRWWFFFGKQLGGFLMVSMRTLLSSSVAVLALLASYPALADDVTTQIEMLRKQIQQQQQQIQQQNQQIQQQENLLEKLEAGVDQSKAQAQQAQAAAQAAANQAAQQAQAAAAAQATSSQASPSGFSVGPNFGDFHFGNATVHVGGKLQADEPLLVNTNDPNKVGTAGNIRRMYLDLKGTFDPNWSYRLEFGSSSGALNVAWAYVGYQGLAPASIWLGYQKTEFSLDNQTADEARIFTEAPLPSAAFVSSKEIGLSVSDYGPWWQAAGGVFNGSATTAPAAGTDNGWQASGRATLFPINQNGMVAEIGGSVADQKASTSDTFTLKSQPEENTVATSFVSTGAIPNVDDMINASVEASAKDGPVLVQGEWMNAMLSRNTVTKALPSQPYFSGWYGQASWVITGEDHPWDAPTATYKSVAPAHPFDPFGTGGWGAFEVAGRYSHVNLTDIGGVGVATSSLPQGKESDTTLALNWYLNNFVRGELDWTHVLPLKAPTNFSGNLNGVSADIVEARGQIVW